MHTYTKEQEKDIRRPITRSILKQLLMLRQSDLPDYNNDVFYLIYMLMYRMALRVSEVTNYSSKFQHALALGDIQFNFFASTLRVTIRSYKNSSQSKVFDLPLSGMSRTIMDRFLQARGNEQGQLFIHQSGKIYTRSLIVKTLRADLRKLGYNAEAYNTHSFRIGRTTDLANDGYSELQIAELGRWTSNAYLKYIRNRIIQA